MYNTQRTVDEGRTQKLVITFQQQKQARLV